MFFSTLIEQDARHTCIACPTAKTIWMVISQLQASLTRSVLLSLQWVFIEGYRALPITLYKVMFDYLRYFGMPYNWSLRNGFLFDGLSRVSQQIYKIKGKRNWQSQL